MSVAIRTSGLTKRFGRMTVVDNLDLEIWEGELFGFLGPNGSGKTTTLRMLLGLVYPTSGDMEVLGEPMPRRRKRALPQVGALVEGPAFYPHLSARRNLALFDSMGRSGSRRTRDSRIEQALERVGLVRVGRKPVKAFSSGMRQRLGLAAAMMRPHRLLVLDEPTNALDPQGARDVRDLLQELVAEGTTVVLSSHLLAEIELVCTRAAIVHRGRLIVQDEVAKLRAPSGKVTVVTPDVGRAEALLDRRRAVRFVGSGPDTLVLELLEGATTDQLNALLVGEGLRVQELIQERPTLEDVFLRLTQPGANDAGG